MTGETIEARAQRLQSMVRSQFMEWHADPFRFAAANPDIEIAEEVSMRTAGAALRAIAERAVDGSGFDYVIADIIGTKPEFYIGQFDARRQRAPSRI